LVKVSLVHAVLNYGTDQLSLIANSEL